MRLIVIATGGIERISHHLRNNDGLGLSVLTSAKSVVESCDHRRHLNVLLALQQHGI
jgi:hypothetical protein